jgi:uncharacterized protein YggU (UPF0235/DUF167 family)
VTEPSSYEVAVRVIPRSRRDIVDGERAGRVLVRVTAAPVDGRANEAVCRVLAAHLALPARALTVIAGHRSRDKVIRVGG